MIEDMLGFELKDTLQNVFGMIKYMVIMGAFSLIVFGSFALIAYYVVPPITQILSNSSPCGQNPADC